MIAVLIGLGAVLVWARSGRSEDVEDTDEVGQDAFDYLGGGLFGQGFTRRRPGGRGRRGR